MCSDFEEKCPEDDDRQCILRNSCSSSNSSGNGSCKCIVQFSCSKSIPEDQFDAEKITVVPMIESTDDGKKCSVRLCPRFQEICPSKSGKCRLERICNEAAGACKCLVHSACLLTKDGLASRPKNGKKAT